MHFAKGMNRFAAVIVVAAAVNSGACGSDSSSTLAAGGSAGADAGSSYGGGNGGAAGSGGTAGVPSDSGTDSGSCSRASIEAQMNATLTTLATDTDFSLYAERGAGETFVFERGSSTMATSYESASTSKMVTAAVVLWLVEQGVMSLDDTPSKYLSKLIWSLAPNDPLYSVTLSQLLSFTSGLAEEAPCVNMNLAEFTACVASVVKANEGTGKTAGTEFYYSSSHMQVAGLMAIEASGQPDWHSLFADFKAKTGLFPNSDYDLPSTGNPRLAGGMHWTGNDYVQFLRAYKTGAFSKSFPIAIEDRTKAVTMGNSPSIDGLGEEWHYGYGLWIECRNATFDCTTTTYVSSPGAYGAYPFVNLPRDFFGIVARQGALGSFPQGVKVLDSVRPELEAWADCGNP